MFLQSKDTTINRGVDTTQIVNDIKGYLIKTPIGEPESQLIIVQRGVVEDWVVLGLGEGLGLQPKPFDQPLLFQDNGLNILVIDLRTSTRWDKLGHRPVVTNPAVFRRDIVRILLEAVWVDHSAQLILNLGHYQVATFGQWIAEMLAKRFVLDVEQQSIIQVIASYYYLCQFTQAGLLDPRKTIPIISKVTRLNVPFVLESLKGIDYIENIEDFLKTIQESLQTERLAGVGIDVMISLLAGSWFGPNHSILVGVALEYPPMWVTLLYLSLTDRSSRMSGIAKLALRKETDPLTKSFVAATSRLLVTQSSLSAEQMKGGLR